MKTGCKTDKTTKMKKGWRITKKMAKISIRRKIREMEEKIVKEMTKIG